MTVGKKNKKTTHKNYERRRIAARVSLNPGASPGTLTAVPGSGPAVVTVLSCTGDGDVFMEHMEALNELPIPARKGMRWVRVTGMGAVEPLVAIAEYYGIRRLALEDVLSRGWRTKAEEHGEYAFFLLHSPPEAVTKRKGEHVSLFCRPGLLITFEDSPTALVGSLWERVLADPPTGKIGHLAEFFAYMLLDNIVDGFFPHLDEKDEILATLEEKISEHVPTREELHNLHTVKRDLITLRRLLMPYKELRTELQRNAMPEALRELKPYLNDLNDHIVLAGELLDTYYEVARSLDEISQSAISNRMNDIIKLLTVISTMFMPLSFIAGVYGMNFNTEHPMNMPELTLPYGYPLVLLAMACIGFGMLWLFKRKGWF